MLFSNDAFLQTYTLQDITRDSNGLRTGSSGSICQTLSDSDCKSLQISSASSVAGILFVMTSSGLFVNTDASDGIDYYTGFSQLFTSQPIIDNSGYRSQKNRTLLFSSSDCITGSNSSIDIVVAYPSSSTSLVDSLLHLSLFSTSNSSLDLDFSQSFSITNVPTISPLFQIFDSHYDTFTSTILVAAGTPLVAPLVGPQMYNNGTLLVFLAGSKASPSISFSFPKTDILVGFARHSNAIDVFVYGNSLWHSVDGGKTFNMVYNTTLVAPNDVIVDMVLEGDGGDGFVFKTNSSNMFYGKISASEVVQVGTSSPNSNFNKLVGLSGASKSFAEISLNSSSCAGPTYPSGLVADSLGNLRSSSNPFILVTRVAIESNFNPIEYRFNSSLVPVFLDSTTVFMFIFDSIYNSFSQPNVNWKISQVNVAGGGSAIVQRIISSGRIAECKIESQFVSESSTNSPALNNILTIFNSKISFVSSGNILNYTTWDAVGLNLSPPVSGGSVGAGWLYSDIGKTIVVNQGSIIITSIVNNTYALGSIAYYPTSTTAAPTYWNMYDFRSFAELAVSNQSATITSSGTTGLFFVSVNSGLFSFGSSGKERITRQGKNNSSKFDFTFLYSP